MTKDQGWDTGRRPEALRCSGLPATSPLRLFLFGHVHYKQLLEAAVSKTERNGKVLKYCFLFEKIQTSKHLGSALGNMFGETEMIM